MALAAAATLAGGAISSAGQYYANQANLDYTKWKNNVDWNIAQQNNATQIALANSAHQREVADLRAAGLNPILSAGGSGAASPQLRSAEMGTYQTDNPVSSLGMSAKEAAAMHSAQVQATVENLEAQNSNILSQNKVLEAQARQEQWKADHPTEYSRKRAEVEDAARDAQGLIDSFKRPSSDDSSGGSSSSSVSDDSGKGNSNPNLFKAELDLDHSAKSADTDVFHPVRIKDRWPSFTPVRIRDMDPGKRSTHSAIFTR